MGRMFRFIPAVLLAGVFASGCGIPQEKYDADMAALQAELDKVRGDLDSALKDALAEKQALDSEIAKLKEELERLVGERDAAIEAAKKRLETLRRMLSKFKQMIESGKIKIKIANNKMIVEMASEILFPSGKAKLSPKGKEALQEVAQVLATIGDRNFQVAGHTDNVPIKKKKFKTNWELSTARAVAVVKYMIKQGMTADNLSAAGYAETQPAASNDTEEGKAQNRRIEIVLQPNLDELPDLSELEEVLGQR
jgi:chemotaxis protein MotB